VAQELGSGIIDLTSRANLQIRGVAEAPPETGHEAVLARLLALGLLPDDPALEMRRNILLPFDWVAGDDSHVIAQELVARLAELPEMPAKAGYAVDAGLMPVLQACSADFRVERGISGGLILRADGAAMGRAVSRDTAVSAILEMAEWFVASGGIENRRMGKHLQHASLPDAWMTEAPAQAVDRVQPGAHTLGQVLAVAFGQIDAARLIALMEQSGAEALRVTPWRMFLLEGGHAVEAADFISDARDPLLRIDACPGAPFCAASTVDTRALALAIAAKTTGAVHISGCAKGCAHPRAAQTTLVGRDGLFDLVRDGAPWDEPVLTGLPTTEIPHRIGDL
jgi:precorrin-3B synthase